MSRNQHLPSVAENSSNGVIFTVDGSGISPAAPQTVSVARGDTFYIHMDPTLTAGFTHVCIQQDDECQCSAAVSGELGGGHMVINQSDGYQINMSVAVNSDYELYALTDEGPVANTTNGNIHIGG